MGQDLQNAIQCLVRLGRGDEIDALREQVIAIHKGNWRLLEAAAQSYLNDPFHFGFMVAGKFHRGQHRGGGRMVNTSERDRVRALQLFVQGLDAARRTPIARPSAGTCIPSPEPCCSVEVTSESWRLQSLTRARHAA